MHSRKKTNRRSAQGFGLVELLVGVAIGVVGILIMFQTVSVMDSRNRTASNSNEAQITASLGAYTLGRDIYSSGMGFGGAPTNVMGCTVNGVDTSGATVRNFNFSFVPAQIIRDATGGPDTIRVLYGNSSYTVAQRKISAGTSTSNQLDILSGVQQGDLLVLADGANPAHCELVEATNNTTAGQLSFEHRNTQYINFYTTVRVPSRFNGAAGTTYVYSAGSAYDLGPTPTLNEWRLKRIPNTAASSLVYRDLLRNTADFEISEDIVDMRAQYGVDTNSTQGATEIEWTNVVPNDWTQLRAIRFALLVRSKQYERPVQGDRCIQRQVTGADIIPAWSGGNFNMTNVDGTADSYAPGGAAPNNWRCYRYRVDEKTIPLRNVIWATAP
jgi:type IV pilus assembly protein PilW